MAFPLTYLIYMILSTQLMFLQAELIDFKAFNTAFFVINVKQRYLQTEFDVRPVLVRRRPKEVLLAWLVHITRNEPNP
jgi:hypothetical protein